MIQHFNPATFNLLHFEDLRGQTQEKYTAEYHSNWAKMLVRHKLPYENYNSRSYLFIPLRGNGL